MPSLSASIQPSARALLLRPLTAATLLLWSVALCCVGCRDMREDANYCSTCDGSEITDGTMTVPQESTEPGAESESSSDPASSSGGRMSGSTSTSNQAGTGNGSQGASAAAPSGGASGSSGVPVAGTRGGQTGGAAARGGNGGPSGNERDAGNSDNGSNGMRDAGSQEPTEPEPEPKPDAGSMTPALPCNGPCPNDRPVCDESKPTPQCVQCTAQEQFACVGATSTCDVEQQKCVQCTPEDARHCDGATPTCNKDNRCVACAMDVPSSCPAAQPLCDNEQRCVECLPGRPGDCLSDNRTMCNGDGQCVECMDDSQCSDPAKPRCDTGNNSCVGCERSEDCGRFPGLAVCDGESKECVGCSPTGELCPAGQYCDRALYQCVPGQRKKQGCTPCGGDSECADSPSIAACLEGQQENGRFCFTATPADAPACEQGYAAGRRRDGIMYCLPINSFSCAAINNVLNNNSCENANECGRGGQCPMPPENTCKIPCNDPLACPAPLQCDLAAKFCK